MAAACSILHRCESCNGHLSDSVYCLFCGEYFDKAFSAGQTLRCPRCERCADGPPVLCKRCHYVAMADLQSLPNPHLPSKGDYNSTQMSSPALHRSVSSPVARDASNESNNGPRLFGTEAGSENCSLVALCQDCNIKFAPNDEVASCPQCRGEAFSFEEVREALCQEAALSSVDGMPDAQPPWMRSQDDELWRFVGCFCQNNEPCCFDLQRAESPKKSFYCLNCRRPYGRYIFKAEVSGERCPNCSSGRVETDDIEAGEEVVVCLNCDGEVSKRRVDQHCSSVEGDVQGELERDHAEKFNTECTSCGRAAAELYFVDDEDLWLVQRCKACGKVNRLSKLDPHEAKPEVPAGFEELARHCCGLDKLHPVEEDKEDNLLVCSCRRNSKPICLAACQNPSIPKTVQQLRRSLPAYSSGEIGQPIGTVKFRSAEELQPGDHLDLHRGFYSHHAIVMEVDKHRKQVALIEYTGEMDGRTLKAALSFGAKGRVENTLNSYESIEKCGRLVQYHSLDCFRPDVVVRRAFKRMNDENYHLGKNNCEHFCSWAKTGLEVSRQVDQFKAKAKQVLGSSVIDGALKVVRQLAPRNTPIGMAIEMVEDLRTELMELFSMKSGAWDQTLRMALRLGLRWSIRGLPVLLSFLSRNTKLMSAVPYLDAKVMKPLAETVTNSLLPIEGKKSDKE